MSDDVTDDWRAETQARLPQSRIYASLKRKCTDDPSGPQIVALVDDATFYAFQKTKTILRHMGEFTLHDGDHLFRVLGLMERLLTPQLIDKLSIPELMLLILSAFFHDIGMAVDEHDVLSWKKIWDRTPTYSGERENVEADLFRRFCAAKPDQMARIQTLSANENQSAVELAKADLITDYIRSTHANRALSIIKTDWADKIRYRDVDLTVEFASICFSHNEDASTILGLDKAYLCGPGVVACLPLVAGILRLADILDFDGKRTPAVLFSHLFVRNPVSLREWKKHRSIESWTINRESIQFHAKCGHPAIQAAVHDFCDLIDMELSTCSNIFSSLNEFHRAMSRDLNVAVPLKVDRSRIETKKTIDGRPEYLYRKTQFSLSKSQVIDLLMGTKLYGSPEVALRELIQNSIDACLLRAALEHSWGNSYIPEIKIRYATEDGENTLEISDNGVGMDQHIIDSYYSRVGSSFYKSAEFYELKAQTSSTFVPTSRFGIGILSCFMVADTMIVDTRRVVGPHESSDSINLTIEGQESIFWIRPGARKMPGTTTKLFLRRSKNPWLQMNEEQFVKATENVVPNPPFRILVETQSHSKTRDQSSFRKLNARSLKDHSWDEHDNIREIEVDFGDRASGLVGSALVAVLESRGVPVAHIPMSSKEVEIDGEPYDLEKSIKLSNGSIHLHSSSISLGEDGEVERNSGFSRLAESRCKLSLHGIDVPTTIFPSAWDSHRALVKLEWPLPLLLMIDVCGDLDLDLNSSRTQIIMSEKWLKFEEVLSVAITTEVARKVSADYWVELRKLMLAQAKNANVNRAIESVSRSGRKARKRSSV